MATRPWVLPGDVMEYTDHPEVRDRDEGKLAADIMRAEMKVISLTHNHFDQKDEYGEDIYPVIPDQVRLAVILLAEAYAYNVTRKAAAQKKSETFDDYAYEAAEATDIDPAGLDLDELLDEYKIASSGNIRFRMTAI